MTERLPFIIALVLIPLATVSCVETCAGLVTGDSTTRCTYRDDRPDLGSPVHRAKGGGGLVARLPNGWRVEVRTDDGRWLEVTFPDPHPNLGAAPRGAGWIHEQYLRSCQTVTGDRGVAPPKGPTSGVVRLCWWNTRRLGQGKKDWSSAARALAGCSVVGLGEVMTRNAPGRLAKALGPTWGNLVSDVAVGRDERYREHYAVLYDRRYVQAQTDGSAGDVGFYPDSSDRFAREPWSVPLRAGHFDFRLALLHAIWGDREAERREEVEGLAEAFEWFRGRHPSERDVLLMGDFNRTPEQKGWSKLRALGAKLLLTKGGTTINAEGETKNLYDNVVIDPRATGEWTGKAGRSLDVGMSLTKFRDLVSDHLPVWAIFRTTGPDDD